MGLFDSYFVPPSLFLKSPHIRKFIKYIVIGKCLSMNELKHTFVSFFVLLSLRYTVQGGSSFRRGSHSTTVDLSSVSTRTVDPLRIFPKNPLLPEPTYLVCDLSTFFYYFPTLLPFKNFSFSLIFEVLFIVRHVIFFALGSCDKPTSIHIRVSESFHSGQPTKYRWRIYFVTSQ